MVNPNYAFLDLLNIPTFVLEVDASGDPVYVAFNKTALDATGFRISDLLGKTAREIYPGRLGENTYNRHLKAVESGLAITDEFTLPLRTDLKKIRTTLNPVKDAQGTVTHLVGSSLDITYQQTLLETQAKTDAIANDFEDFVSMAAHDLRAPMRNVQLLTGLLREDFQDLGDGKLEIIDMLSSVADKSMVLISDILSHSAATRAVPDDAEFDFNSTCTDILSILDPKEICRTHVSGGWLYGDRTAIQVTLRNLIDNALKYTDKKEPELWIDAIAQDADTLKITLRDNGPGFNDATVLFLNGGKLRVDSGFGLLGVRRLIRARGGTMEARNGECGSGAIITIMLPGTVISAPSGIDLSISHGSRQETARRNSA